MMTSYFVLRNVVRTYLEPLLYNRNIVIVGVGVKLESF